MVLSTTYNEYQKPENAEAGFASTMNANMDLIDATTAKLERSAVRAPGVGDDIDDGYSAGSIWIYAGGPNIYVCESAAQDAAVWRQVWPVTAVGADIDFGAYEVRAQTFESDVVTGTAPLTIASTTKVANLNADKLDDLEGSAYVVKSLIAARGDIVTGSAASTPSVLTKGTRGGILCAGADDPTYLAKGDQGAILYAGADDPAYLAVGTKGQALSTQGAAANPIYLDRTPGLYHNAVINPQFQIAQRGAGPFTSATTPANYDDTYLLDQWVLLSDGNDIVDVSQEATIVPPGAATSLKLEVETANKKFMQVQFLENKDALKFKGKNVSIQFKAYTVTGKVIENVRAAVLSWSGTADTITSDIVNAWGAEGENITPAATWTLENTPANLANVADAWTLHKIENIAVDTAGMTNLAFAIWCDDTDAAVDDLLYLTDVQLNEGPVCLPFMPRSYLDEKTACMRRYEKSYQYSVAPGTSADLGQCMFGVATSVDYAWGRISPLVPKPELPVPTYIIYHNDGTVNACAITAARTKAAIAEYGFPSSNGLGYIQTSAGFTAGDIVIVHYVINAEL
ncbi:MAG: hypothetical protein WC455_24455 [Dehalococcoidia bacterium]|jgi:hypothetical protein